MWSNSQETANLVTFTEVTLNGKIQFLCSVIGLIAVIELLVYHPFTKNQVKP